MNDADREILKLKFTGMSDDTLEGIYKTPEGRQIVDEKKREMSVTPTKADLIFRVNSLLEPLEKRAKQGAEPKLINSITSLFKLLAELSGVPVGAASKINILNSIDSTRPLPSNPDDVEPKTLIKDFE